MVSYAGYHSIKNRNHKDPLLEPEEHCHEDAEIEERIRKHKCEL